MFKKILLTCFSLLISLILCEFLVRFYYPQNLDGYYLEQNESGLWILKNNYTYYDHFDGKTYIYNTGKLRNRVTDNFKNDKEKVLILGDSFTFGYRLNDKDTYVSKLQNIFKDYYFVNSASPNWGLSDYSRYVEDYCKTFELKKVIIFLNTDDIGRVYQSNQYILNDDNITTGVQGKYNAWYTKYYENPFINVFLSNSHLIRFVAKKFLDISRLKINNSGERIDNKKFKEKRILYPQRQLKSEHEVNLYIKKSKLILERLKKNIENCNLNLYFIYSGWVNFENKANNLNNFDPNAVFLKEADKLFNSLKIKFFNNTDEFLMKDVNLNRYKYIIKDDHHPNKLGSDILFEVVKDDIKTILNY